jgi:hypothetical protein
MGRRSVIKRPSEFLAITLATKKTFQEFDEKMRLVNPDHKSLSDAWDKACEFKDTNEIINHNLRQTQAFIDKAVKDYLEVCLTHEKQLKEIMTMIEYESDPKTARELTNNYMTLSRDLKRVEREQYRMINEMTTTLTGLAKEYRSCLLSQRFYLHVKDFEKMLLFFKMVIIKEVHNQETIKRISDELEEGAKNMFAMEAQFKETTK